MAGAGGLSAARFDCRRPPEPRELAPLAGSCGASRCCFGGGPGSRYSAAGCCCRRAWFLPRFLLPAPYTSAVIFPT
eukprot:1139114-Prymnesium_polylepis.1